MDHGQPPLTPTPQQQHQQPQQQQPLAQPLALPLAPPRPNHDNNDYSDYINFDPSVTTYGLDDVEETSSQSSDSSMVPDHDPTSVVQPVYGDQPYHYDKNYAKILRNPRKRQKTFYSEDSFEKKIQSTKRSVLDEQDKLAEVQLQTLEQFQITSLNKQILDGEQQQKIIMAQIKTMERLQKLCPELGSQTELKELQEMILHSTHELEQLKIQLAKTKNTADNFKSFIAMPQYKNPPLGSHRDCLAMDPRNINKIINKFNPAQHPALEFKHIWTEVLRYGRVHYLNENEHLEVLGYVLSGEPLETYESCIRSKKDLRQTLTQLNILHGTNLTINDYKKQLNSFSRHPNESIRKTMARYHAILEKTQHGMPDHLWHLSAQIKEIKALKTFIHAKIRANIELEEARNDKEGSAMLPLEHWINRVEEFENAYNLVPTKEVKSAVLTAPMAQAASLQATQFSQEKFSAAVQTLHHCIEELQATLPSVFQNRADAQKTLTPPAQPPQTDHPQNAQLAQQGQLNKGHQAYCIDGQLYGPISTRPQPQNYHRYNNDQEGYDDDVQDDDVEIVDITLLGN